MGLKKKKNVIILSVCMVVSFILYQLYFFLTITSEANKNYKVILVDHNVQEEANHLHSEADRHINHQGVIKGVYFLHMPKYRPDSNNEFNCLKSEQKIPFECVNDDYCDCEDGTDEPSTNACVNGTFYCDTQKHKKPRRSIEGLNKVPSSRVNDGICDCCDGSDEWLSENKILLSQSTVQHYRYYVTKCSNKCHT